jgi:solute carrier family 12 (potassium/chloride transporters), member 9
MLDSRKEHVKFWRPQMLLLVASPRSCCPLIHFVNDMKKGGLYVVGHVKTGEFKDNEEDPTIEEYSQWLSLVDHMKVKAFVELTLAKNVREGTQHLIRIAGMGAMKINTVLLGFYDEEECYDFFDDENSPYRTNKFTSSNTGILFPHRKMNEGKSLGQDDYVSIVSDVLRMKKNVCLCRHFHRLNKTTISKSNHIKFIDLWPINIFDPSNSDPFDTASKFMMQLACIINMLPVWKNLQLRVFLCEVGENEQQPLEHPPEVRLNQLLKQLRISAVIQKIPEWKNSNETPRNRSFLKNLTRNSENESAATMSEENLNRMKLHMQRINQMIRDHSNSTAVTFMYLPPPPNNSVNFKTKCSNYLVNLNFIYYEIFLI